MPIELVAHTQANPVLTPELVADFSDLATLWRGRGSFAENMIEYAGRVCYRSTERMGTAPEFITARVREGHEDIIEHIVVTLRFTETDEPLRWRMVNRHCEVSELGNQTWLVSGNTRVWLDFFRRGIALGAVPILKTIAPGVFAEFAGIAEIGAIGEIGRVGEITPALSHVLTPVQDGPMRVTLLGYTQPVIDDPALLEAHGAAVFLFEGISRACTHQLVRHRLGSFSQESQRYVKMDVDKATPWSRFTKEEEREITELYSVGQSTIEIARRYGCSPQTVSNVVQRQQYAIRPRGDHKAGRPDLFAAPITAPVDAQLLGLLFADGYVFHEKSANSYQIGLKMAETHLVQQAQRLLGASGWRYSTEGLAQTILASASVYDRLVNVYGCVPNKSLVVHGELLSQNLPAPMHSHFLRGYFEGDGSLGVYHDVSNNHTKVMLSFVSGSERFLKWCDEVIAEHCHTRPKKLVKAVSNNSYRLQYQGVNEIERVLMWMYYGMDMQLCHWSKFVLAAELFPPVWNVGKAAVLQECQRLGMICPPSILEQPQTATIYLETLQAGMWAYEDLKGFARAEDRRFILPNAAETRIVTSMNFAAWSHFCWLRAVDKAAQWEIRIMAQYALRMLYAIAPTVFQPHWDVYQEKFANRNA
jgi:thymidylate synthase ThyX